MRNFIANLIFKTLMTSIVLAAAVLDQSAKAETIFDHLNLKFDASELQSLQYGPTSGNCHEAQYVEQVKIFLLTAFDFDEFVPAANGAFNHKIYSHYEKGEFPNYGISRCFAEGLIYASMPDVLKAYRALKDDRKKSTKIFNQMMNVHGAKTPMLSEESQIIRAVKFATITQSLIGLSAIRTCDFQDDPTLFLSAALRIQSLVGIAFGGMGVDAIISGDACSKKVFDETGFKYIEVLDQKAALIWGK